MSCPGCKDMVLYLLVGLDYRTAEGQTVVTWDKCMGESNQILWSI